LRASVTVSSVDCVDRHAHALNRAFAVAAEIRRTPRFLVDAIRKWLEFLLDPTQDSGFVVNRHASLVAGVTTRLAFRAGFCVNLFAVEIHLEITLAVKKRRGDFADDSKAYIIMADL